MFNVKYTIEKRNVGTGKDAKKDVPFLMIEVDLSQRGSLSKSGDTIAVGGTQGNQKVGVGDIAFGLNVYTKEGLPEAREAAGLPRVKAK